MAETLFREYRQMSERMLHSDKEVDLTQVAQTVMQIKLGKRKIQTKDEAA